MSVPTPPLIPEPFAVDGDRASIPDTTIAVGRASYNLGFPAITMLAKIAGGIPPDGRDMNGVIYDVTAHAFFLQAGKVFGYSAGVSSAISGYDIGAMLQSSDGKTMWLNQSASNTANPDADGAGWVAALTYGSAAVTGLIGGSVTIPLSQSRFGTLVLSGTLTANLAVVLPLDLRQWRIVNNTTGAFTTTARTASGTGVLIPQGGFTNSTSVFGDGTNIYFDTPPISIPSDVSPTANTLLMRDNVGDGFVRYLNTSIAPAVFPISNFIAQQGADGYMRPIPVAQAAAQLGTIGVGQTWSNPVRGFNTDYTNTSGRPIFISITVGLRSGGGTASLFCDGAFIGQVVASGADTQFQLTAVIPAGSVYRLSTSGIVLSGSWAELR